MIELKAILSTHRKKSIKTQEIRSARNEVFTSAFAYFVHE